MGERRRRCMSKLDLNDPKSQGLGCIYSRALLHYKHYPNRTRQTALSDVQLRFNSGLEKRNGVTEVLVRTAPTSVESANYAALSSIILAAGLFGEYMQMRAFSRV
ncbi:hypothetical protein RB213_010891 [Colletotrichum asianum]